jgi:hypothetical protein
VPKKNTKNLFVEIPKTKRSLAQTKIRFGVGINDADYNLGYVLESGRRILCPFYKRWDAMLTRCYSEDSLAKWPTYNGCSVCEEWLLFSNFKKWMISQDWEGNHLDKDILIPGNKIYSPETCCFISPEVNTLLVYSKTRIGKYPIGVSYHKASKKYFAQCAASGKHVNIGIFDTAEDAENAYRTYKSNHVKEVALLHIEDKKLYAALIVQAERIEQGLHGIL